MKTKTIEELKQIIREEKPFVDLKPYSHNIISLTLQQIAKEYGYDAANNIIKELELEKKGWRKEDEVQ